MVELLGAARPVIAHDESANEAGDRSAEVRGVRHAAELQIPHPEFCARFDKVPETAVKSRRKLLENAPRWHGAHLPFPGVVAIDWQPNPR